MKRERATQLLEDLLRQARSKAWPAALVQAVYVFGSYARGALQPGDLGSVDLHGLVLGQARPPFYVDFEMRSLPYALERLEEHAATHWLEVLRPARRGPMRALDIAVSDRAELIGRPEDGILFFRKLPQPRAR